MFESHCKRNYHKETLISSENFLQICNGKKEDIKPQVNNDFSKHIGKKKKKLRNVGIDHASYNFLQFARISLKRDK